jgi:uncharacterized protein YndB with AHSA1/START domain
MAFEGYATGSNEPRPEVSTTPIYRKPEITMEPVSEGTRYRALVRHKSTQDRVKHEEMGFFKGWGICLTQLEELAAQLRT